MSLRVLSYNIRYGGTGREKLIAGVINSCEPGLVVLEEATNPGVVERLASRCGMPDWGAMRGESVAYLSRTQLAGHSWHKIRFARRAYLEVLLASGTRVFGVHLSAIHSNITERRRMYELGSLIRSVKAAERHGFHMVTGDFNTLAPGEELDVGRLPARLRFFTWLTGRKIRWRTIQLMLDAGYVDGYRLLHPGDEGLTFPVWDPHVRLDYAFVPEAEKARLLKCEIVNKAPSVRDASDHYPLLMEIDG